MSFKLPAFFDSKVKKPEPTSKEGRIRSKEHVHVSFELPSYISSALPDFEAIDPIIPNGAAYHLSLTRTLYVKDHQKDLFKTKMESTIRKTLKLKPLPETVKCEKVSLSLYFNDDNTRTFIAIDLENNESIINLIKEVDSTLKDFNLPIYYTSPKLHFSVLWSKGNHPEALESIKDVEEKKDLKVDLKEIIIKCGNKVSKIEL